MSPSLITRPAVAAFLASVLLSCSGDGPTAPSSDPVVASIVVTPGSDTLVTVGRTRQYAAQAREADGTPIPGVVFLWSSADTNIAVVSADGIVTARGGGVASIRATVGAVVGTSTMAVVQFVAGVTVTPGADTLVAVGDTAELAAVARDSSGAIVPGVRFLWSTNNSGAVTVDTLGRAIATGSGEASISATGRGTPGYAQITVAQEAVSLAFVQSPTNVTAGEAISPAIQVELRDARGAVLRDVRTEVTLKISSGGVGASLGGSDVVSTVAGVATFSGMWLDEASTYTLSASAEGVPLVESGSFTVIAGPATRLAAAVNTPIVEAGVSEAVTVSVFYYDAYGNLATFAPAELRLRSASRPNATFTVQSSQDFPSHRLYRGRVDRAGGDFIIEAALGTSVAQTSTFASRTTFSKITAGELHACGLAPGGTFCWGDGIRLGRGFMTRSDSVPGLVTTNQSFVDVDVGFDNSCGLTSAGAVFCWRSSPFTPQLVAGTGPGGVIITKLAVGPSHSCGLAAGGSAYCWGFGTEGQLGHGLFSNSSTPVQVSGSGSGDLVFVDLATGASSSCAVTASTTAYCWGYNLNGQIGDSTFVNRALPTLVRGSGIGARAFSSISVGGSHSCAVNTTGAVACWGINSSGELGISPGADRPTPQQAVGVSGASQVSAGNASTCAVSSGGTYCWGSNEHGKLGRGSFLPTGTPDRISLGQDVAQRVTVGGGFACARTPTATVYCWGRNTSGELGIGSLVLPMSAYPLRVVW